MKNRLVLSVACLSGFLAGGAGAATTYFSDGFENQTNPLKAPDIGLSWSDNGTGHNYDLTTTSGQVNSGTTALKTNTPGGGVAMNLLGTGTSGALVAGNVIQYVINVNQLTLTGDPAHNFNAPIQLSLTTSAGAKLAQIGTLNGGSEDYEATNAGTAQDLGVKVPRNTVPYDTLRVVMTLTSPGLNQIGGTYDFYVKIDGGAEQKLASGFVLNTVTLPSSNATNPAFVIQRGGSTSTSFYDDISITSVDLPEPSTISAVTLIGGVALRRRKRH